jgi:transposase-like protein
MAKRYPSEFRQRHVLEFARSGKTIRQYCTENGLKPATLLLWRRKLNQSGSSQCFQEVLFPAAQLPDFLIEYPNGIKLQINRISDLSIIKELVK